MMRLSPWRSTWNRTRTKIRPIRTTQPRFVYPAVPTRMIEPCTVSTRLHSELSFGQIHDQISKLTVPELVLSSHLDKPKTTAEPDLTWIVRFPKMITTSLSWSVWREPSVLKTEPKDYLSCPTLSSTSSFRFL